MANQGKNGATIAVLLVVGFCAMTCATGVGVGVFFFLGSAPEALPPSPDGPPGAQAVEVFGEEEHGSDLPGAGLEPSLEQLPLEEQLEILANAREVTLAPDVERFEGMDTVGLVEVMAMVRLVEASAYEQRKPLGEEVTLSYRLPNSTEDAKWSRTASEDIYTGVGALSYLVSSTFEQVYQSWSRPEVCVPRWGDGKGWDYFDETCQNFVYNELFKRKYGVDLYEGVGRLSPEGVKVLLGELRGLEGDAAMLEATTSKVYQVLAPAVSDYLTVWKSLDGKQKKRLLKRYRDALAKRGMVRGEGSTRDMIALYYDLDEAMHLHVGLRNPDYSHTILGFWLRRMNDGTAEELATFLEERQAKWGASSR